MNNEGATGAEGDQGLVHAGDHGVDSLGGATAPVAIPHVADDDGGAGGVQSSGGFNDAPLTGAGRAIDARAEGETKGRAGSGGEGREKDGPARKGAHGR